MQGANWFIPGMEGDTSVQLWTVLLICVIFATQQVLADFEHKFWFMLHIWETRKHLCMCNNSDFDHWGDDILLFLFFPNTLIAQNWVPGVPIGNKYLLFIASYRFNGPDAIISSTKQFVFNQKIITKYRKLPK